MRLKGMWDLEPLLSRKYMERIHNIKGYTKKIYRIILMIGLST